MDVVEGSDPRPSIAAYLVCSTIPSSVTVVAQSCGSCNGGRHATSKPDSPLDRKPVAGLLAPGQRLQERPVQHGQRRGELRRLRQPGEDGGQPSPREVRQLRRPRDAGQSKSVGKMAYGFVRPPSVSPTVAGGVQGHRVQGLMCLTLLLHELPEQTRGFRARGQRLRVSARHGQRQADVVQGPGEGRPVVGSVAAKRRHTSTNSSETASDSAT